MPSTTRLRYASARDPHTLGVTRRSACATTLSPEVRRIFNRLLMCLWRRSSGKSEAGASSYA